MKTCLNVDEIVGVWMKTWMKLFKTLFETCTILDENLAWMNRWMVEFAGNCLLDETCTGWMKIFWMKCFGWKTGWNLYRLDEGICARWNVRWNLFRWMNVFTSMNQNSSMNTGWNRFRFPWNLDEILSWMSADESWMKFGWTRWKCWMNPVPFWMKCWMK